MEEVDMTGKTVAECYNMRIGRAKENKTIQEINEVDDDEICVGSIDDMTEKSVEDNETANNKKPRDVDDKKEKKAKNFKKWWKKEEVIELYKAIIACGLNFSMIEAYMKYTRTRQQIKLRYKVEYKLRPEIMNKAINANLVMTPEVMKEIIDNYNENEGR